MTAALGAWLGAFALTQLVETPIHARALGPGRPWARRLLLGFGASAITHPIVFFGFPRLLPTLFTRDYWSGVAAAEAFAVAVEALYLRRLGVERAIPWALLANAASVAVGLLTRAGFGWP